MGFWKWLVASKRNLGKNPSFKKIILVFTASILKELGFKEIKQMDITTRLVDEKNEFSIAILKSGDFTLVS